MKGDKAGMVLAPKWLNDFVYFNNINNNNNNNKTLECETNLNAVCYYYSPIKLTHSSTDETLLTPSFKKKTGGRHAPQALQFALYFVLGARQERSGGCWVVVFVKSLVDLQT